MTPFITKKHPKWVICFLALILIFTPLFNAPASYAAESAPPTDISTDISTVNSGLEPATVTNSTYKAQTNEAQDPLAPQNLRIESVSHNMAIFQWDFKPVEGENNIQVWDADSGKWLAWGNYWTRAVTGLTPETTYRIYITWDGDVKKNTKAMYWNSPQPKTKLNIKMHR